MIGTRRNWSEKQDETLCRLVKKFKKLGSQKWAAISEEMNENSSELRTIEQCKKRWENYLDPRINKGKWGRDEIKLIFLKHAQLGNRWVNIVEYLNNRTTGDVKNQFHCALRRGLRRMYKIIDPKEKMTNKIKAIKPNDLSNLLINLQQNKVQCYQMLFQLSGDGYKNWSVGANTKQTINFLTQKYREKFQGSFNRNQSSNSSLLESDSHSREENSNYMNKYLRQAQVQRQTFFKQCLEKQGLRPNSIQFDFTDMIDESYSQNNRQNFDNNLHPQGQSSHLKLSHSEISSSNFNNKNNEKLQKLKQKNKGKGRKYQGQAYCYKQEAEKTISLDENSLIFQYHDKVLDMNFREFFQMEDSQPEFDVHHFNVIE